LNGHPFLRQGKQRIPASRLRPVQYKRIARPGAQIKVAVGSWQFWQLAALALMSRVYLPTRSLLRSTTLPFAGKMEG
jgi:hypothetical protein